MPGQRRSRQRFASYSLAFLWNMMPSKYWAKSILRKALTLIPNLAASALAWFATSGENRTEKTSGSCLSCFSSIAPKDYHTGALVVKGVFRFILAWDLKWSSERMGYPTDYHTGILLWISSRW